MTTPWYKKVGGGRVVPNIRREHIWVEREEVCERLEEREGADPGGARRPQPLTAPKPLQYLCIIWKLVEVM